MRFPFGNNLKLYIDGGSHDEKMTMRLEGFPQGVRLDRGLLDSLMARRAPGGALSTARKEKDEVIFTSGIENEKTTGETVTAVVYNCDADPSAYENINDTPRPSHADYAAVMKYGEKVDLRGGGHFSGRLTVLLCAAGALCESFLRRSGIEVFAKIGSVGEINDIPFNAVNPVGARQLKEMSFPVLDPAAGEKMKELIGEAREQGDSVGGTVECAVTGLPAGLGEHMFAGAEARISSAVFAVPGVKGIEFGSGFAGSRLKGSENNDPFFTDGESVFTHSNNAGGILGGMTSGMPVIFRAALKPTPTIAKKQRTVSLSQMKNIEKAFGGRHDPCIVPRAAAAIEAAAAIAVCDMLLDPAAKEEKTLPEMRKRIDSIDGRIVSLLCERAEISGMIGEIKKERQLPVRDEEREKELLSRLCTLAGEKNAPLVAEIYGSILSNSRKLQKSNKKVFLIGRKLSHSLSVPIHAEFGLYDYSLCELEPDELAPFFEKGGFDALNVTIPYKKAVIPFIGSLDETALRTGSVNTVIKTENGLRGYNTDLAGFKKMLRFCNISVCGKKALVLGSGGAGTAVKCALLECGASEVTVISRSGENNYGNLHLHADAGIIVNATPVGMFPEEEGAPVDLSLFPECRAVIDLIYNPAKTNLLLQAEKLGIKHTNGLPMLVFQAAEACSLICGESVKDEKCAEIIARLAERERNIVLVGMPGCGKTTVGRLLAEKLGMDFADTDETVKSMTGREPAEIIAAEGEAAFRKAESEAIRLAAKLRSAVIATGGGALTVRENIDPLRRSGIIVYIKAELSELSAEGRPVTAEKGIAALFEERRAAYEEFCDLSVSRRGSAGETAELITDELKNAAGGKK